MSYTLSYVQVQNETQVIHSFDSFLLFYSFTYPNNRYLLKSFHAAFLAVEQSSVLLQRNEEDFKANSDEMASPCYWPASGNATLALNHHDNVDSDTNTIKWLSGTISHTSQVKSGHTYVTLHSSGSNYAVGTSPPPVAGTSWIKEAKGSFGNDDYYMPQIITSTEGNDEGPKIEVHAVIKSGTPTKLQSLGYVGPFVSGMGFDLIMGSMQLTNIPPSPTFTFPGNGHDGNSLYSKDFLVAPKNGTSGCAMVLAGSFKRLLPLISKQVNDFLTLPMTPGVDVEWFAELMEDMVSSLPCITNPENCVKKTPSDPSSSDAPVELILFHNNGGL